MRAPYKCNYVGSTPTGTTTMKHKYLHKLVEIKLDGKFQTGFVIEEFDADHGDYQWEVLMQKTKEIVSFYSIYNQLKLLEE